MLGGIAPRIKSIKLSDSTLLLTKANTTLGVNTANNFSWGGTHAFNGSVNFFSTAQFNSTTYFYTYPYFWYGSYNYGQMYIYGSMYFNSATYGYIPYANSANNIQFSPNLFYDDVNLLFGVQTTTPSAVGHFVSANASTISNPTYFAMSANTFALPGAPNSVTYSAITPDIARPNLSGTATNFTSGAYASGDVIDYVITAGYDDGFGNITWGISTNSVTGVTDSGAGTFDVNISTGASGFENLTTNVWSISRQINGGGYNDYQRITSTSFYDDNTTWVGGGDTFTTFADDFLANGTTYTNNFYGTKSSPVSTEVYSVAYNYNYSDANDQSTYKLQIYISGGSYDYGYTLDWNGSSSLNGMADSSWINIAPSTLNSGAATTTPNTYGYLSDGSNSVDFDYYKYDTGLGIYSSGYYRQSWSDPNNGQYYYFNLYSFSEANGKVLRNGTVGKFVTSADNFYDDTVTSFPDSNTVTPTTVYPTTGKFEHNGGNSAILASASYALDTVGAVKMTGLDSGAGAPGSILSTYRLYVDSSTGQLYVQ